MTVVIDEGRFAPEQIRFHQFRVTRRGFDQDEVAAFLGELAEHVVELEAKIAEAAQREQATKAVAEALHQKNEALEAEHAQLPVAPEPAPDLDQARAEAAAIVAVAEEEARRIIAVARRRAQGMHQQAQAFMEAAGACDSTSQTLALFSVSNGGSMADTLTERAEMILEAEQRVQNAREQLLDEAQQITVAARRVVTRFSASGGPGFDVVEVEAGDTVPVELFDQADSD